jgi:predicted SAM-dependent methyltransferase
MLFVAVPDLDVLCRMSLDPNMTTEQRLFIARMIYGGQTDRYDFHLYGYNEESLAIYLKEAGFCNIQRVGNFNLFMDTSTLIKYGYNISLNMVASVCPEAGKEHDGFAIQHSADVYVKPNFMKV